MMFFSFSGTRNRKYSYFENEFAIKQFMSFSSDTRCYNLIYGELNGKSKKGAHDLLSENTKKHGKFSLKLKISG